MDHNSVYTFNVLPLFDSQPPPTLTNIVLNALADGAVVVTANARAARALKLHHAEQQRAIGLTMWGSPAIFDWDTWLHHLWNEHSSSSSKSPLLLTPLQEHAVWLRVQRKDARLVVSPDDLAALAQSGYRRLKEYELRRDQNSSWLEPDAEHFRQWAMSFDQLCNAHNWTSHSSIEALLSRAAQTSMLILPRLILLAGFDRFTPSQQTLLHNLREAKVHIEVAAQEPPAELKHTLLVASDSRDELYTCAEWSRSKLANDASIRIGVIAPDVSNIRSEATRVFQTVLMPQSLDVANTPVQMPFEFSLGEPLSTVPVVRAALLLLRWISTQLREEDISWLLLSDFFNINITETLALAQLDFKLRDSGALSPETSLVTFVHDHPSIPFSNRMRKVLREAQEGRVQNGEGRYSHWSELAQKILSDAEWPGYRTADSVQFQAEQRWLRLLDEVSLLDFAATKVKFSDFLGTLERHARETIFTAESHYAPIQILGALESSGQTFDAIWFLGVDDAHWPQAGRPYPLLPISLQRASKMPHCDSATDTELAVAVTRRIAQSAPECIFSYARQNKEGELRASPILRMLFDEGMRTVSTVAFRQQMGLQELPKMHSQAESQILASQIAPWPIDRIAGGADVLKDQAACPFRAFAARRLTAQPLNRTEWGLDAAQRGNLQHHILEAVWSPETPEAFRMITVDDLKAVTSAGRLDEVLRYHIGNAFESLIRKNSANSWMQAYLESEQRRLLVRLREWMQIEAKRQPFIVEKREERLRDVNVGSLKLNLRADRIDKLPDDSHLLIDYKTGEVNVSAWNGERPDEPQLPLYAVYGNVERVSGLLFAQIRAGKTQIAGRAVNARQNVSADLTSSSSLVSQQYDDKMHDAWQQALLQLADEFLHGEASVHPKHGSETCTYCPLPGLCRIAEAGLANEPGEAEAESV
jgi:probable DNA repair protein